MVEHVELVDAVSPGDGFRRVQGAPAREDRETLQHAALVVAEHVVRPVDRASQRLVTFHRGPATARQQSELIVETRRDLGRRHRLDPGRRELDGERDPVEARADLFDRSRVFGRHRELCPRLGRALGEQRDRVAGEPERRQRDHAFARKRESLTTRRHYRDPRRGVYQAIDEFRDRVEQVLAIVEDEQELLRAEKVEQSLVEGLTHARLHPERGSDRLDDRLGLPDGRELAQPRAVAVARERFGRDLGRESRLADTTHAGQRDDPCIGERTHDVGQLTLASHEAGGLERQVARERVERSQWREVAFEILVTDLQYPFGSLEIAQPMLAEVDECDVDERVARELRRGVRYDDLAAVRNRHQARGAVGDRPVVVTLAELRGAAV